MKLRYTKAERIRKAAAEGLLTDPAASPADKAAALRELRYLETAARRRDRAEDTALPAEPQPEPESVDELVRQLEINATVPVPSVLSPLQPVQTVQGSPIGQNVQDGQNDPKLAEVQAIADGKKPQPVMESVEPVCKICHRPAPDPHMLWPIADPNGRRLCPDCFQTMCAMCARTPPRPPEPADWETNFANQRNVYSPDFQKSVEIWREQDIENAERQELERKERDRAEARERADLANRLSGNFGWLAGGRL